MEHTAAGLKRMLRELADPSFCATQQRFFREPIRSLGVRTGEVRRLAAAAAREYRREKTPFSEIFGIAEQLRRGKHIEERGLAIVLLGRFQARLTRGD